MYIPIPSPKSPKLNATESAAQFHEAILCMIESARMITRQRDLIE